MAGGGLVIGEQMIDREVTTDEIGGRQFESITGRVLLHALDGEGRPLCGYGDEPLTAVDRSWHPAYLPHLPRCADCVRLAGDRAGELPDLAARVTGVDIRLAHGSAAEVEASVALGQVLIRHDLRRWLFTDLVTIDDSIRGGVSHPLTLSPPRLLRRLGLALSDFLHEQLHWADGQGTDDVIAEARQRWPDPPPLPAGGPDPEGTWLHMSVCALEYFSLVEVLGRSAAAAELRQHAVYSWIYAQILADPDWFAGFLDRHGLRVPTRAPVPRRYVGDPWWTFLD
ncbi:MAG TPA: hypothetical protein VFI65_10525 [Streptosporangiaceae bacterium]|nr:hypothetical protein [Streptosporangiaceae bacterium]